MFQWIIVLSVRIMVLSVILLSLAACRGHAHWFTAKDGYEWKVYEREIRIQDRFYSSEYDTDGFISRDPRNGDVYKFYYFKTYSLR